MLAMVNTGRLHLYKEDGSPERHECLKEIALCRYWLRGNEQLAWAVPASEGHDDFVVSLALVARAAQGMAPPAAGGLVRPVSDGEEKLKW
jgi:hypothetical protein